MAQQQAALKSMMEQQRNAIEGAVSQQIQALRLELEGRAGAATASVPPPATLSPGGGAPGAAFAPSAPSTTLQFKTSTVYKEFASLITTYALENERRGQMSVEALHEDARRAFVTAAGTADFQSRNPLLVAEASLIDAVMALLAAGKVQEAQVLLHARLAGELMYSASGNVLAKNEGQLNQRLRHACSWLTQEEARSATTAATWPNSRARLALSALEAEHLCFLEGAFGLELSPLPATPIRPAANARVITPPRNRNTTQKAPNTNNNASTNAKPSTAPSAKKGGKQHSYGRRGGNCVSSGGGRVPGTTGAVGVAT